MGNMSKIFWDNDSFVASLMKTETGTISGKIRFVLAAHQIYRTRPQRSDFINLGKNSFCIVSPCERIVRA